MRDSFLLDRGAGNQQPGGSRMGVDSGASAPARSETHCRPGTFRGGKRAGDVVTLLPVQVASFSGRYGAGTGGHDGEEDFRDAICSRPPPRPDRWRPQDRWRPRHPRPRHLGRPHDGTARRMSWSSGPAPDRHASRHRRASRRAHRSSSSRRTGTSAATPSAAARNIPLGGGTSVQKKAGIDGQPRPRVPRSHRLVRRPAQRLPRLPLQRPRDHPRLRRPLRADLRVSGGARRDVRQRRARRPRRKRRMAIPFRVRCMSRSATGRRCRPADPLRQMCARPPRTATA